MPNKTFNRRLVTLARTGDSCAIDHNLFDYIFTFGDKDQTNSFTDWDANIDGSDYDFNKNPDLVQIVRHYTRTLNGEHTSFKDVFAEVSINMYNHPLLYSGTPRGSHKDIVPTGDKYFDDAYNVFDFFKLHLSPQEHKHFTTNLKRLTRLVTFAVIRMSYEYTPECVKDDDDPLVLTSFSNDFGTYYAAKGDSSAVTIPFTAQVLFSHVQKAIEASFSDREVRMAWAQVFIHRLREFLYRNVWYNFKRIETMGWKHTPIFHYLKEVETRKTLAPEQRAIRYNSECFDVTQWNTLVTNDKMRRMDKDSVFIKSNQIFPFLSHPSKSFIRSLILSILPAPHPRALQSQIYSPVMVNGAYKLKGARFVNLFLTGALSECIPNYRFSIVENPRSWYKNVYAYAQNAFCHLTTCVRSENLRTSCNAVYSMGCITSLTSQFMYAEQSNRDPDFNRNFGGMNTQKTLAVVSVHTRSFTPGNATDSARNAILCSIPFFMTMPPHVSFNQPIGRNRQVYADILGSHSTWTGLYCNRDAGPHECPNCGYITFRSINTPSEGVINGLMGELQNASDAGTHDRLISCIICNEEIVSTGDTNYINNIVNRMLTNLGRAELLLNSNGFIIKPEGQGANNPMKVDVARKRNDSHTPRSIISYGDRAIGSRAERTPSGFVGRFLEATDSKEEKSYHTGKLFQAPLYLGIELETQFTRNDAVDLVAKALDGFALLKRDGSIGSNGFEIVTVPATLPAQREIWAPFFATKPESYLKSWSTGCCGLHIHVNRAALSHLSQGRLMKFVNDPENTEFMSHIAGRDLRTNGYCKVLNSSNRWAVGKELRKDASGKTTVRDLTSGGDRYQAVNISSTNGGKTMEFRIFRGNVGYNGFHRSMEFVHALCEFACLTSAPRLHYLDFIEYIGLTENYSRFPELHRWLVKHNYLFVKSLPVDTSKVPATVVERHHRVTNIEDTSDAA